MRWLNRIPLARSLRGYGRQDVRGDLTAGLTTAVMLVPQAMAYAMLAGLPPIVGLYASTVPLLVYALVGSSRQLAVGPVAMVSLMVAAGVSALAEPGSPRFVALAVVLALMVGGIQLVMGLARLGFLVNFLSHPVVSGFTSAAALIIGLSQLKHILGLDIPRSHHVHSIIAAAAGKLGEINLPTLMLGLGAVLALVLLRRWRPGFPGALLVVVVGTALVSSLGLDQRGVAIVGEVPSGLPGAVLPALDLGAMKQLLPTALAIALVGFMESISVAKAFARRDRCDVDANRELMGLGLANLAGSLFQAYPVTGGFSRTAVNAQAGARSGLASVVTALLVAVTLVLFTPLFHFLPRAVLAAIIMVAVFGLVDLREVKHLWRVKRGDLALLGVTFLVTLLVGIEQGILAGVGASILSVMLRTTRPHMALLGRLPGTHVYRNVERHPEAETLRGVIALRIDAQFYFGNVSFLKQAIRDIEERHCVEPLRAIVINASSINQLDSSADSALHEIAADLGERGVELYLAEVRGPVLDVMRRSGLVERLGEDHFLLTMRQAMKQAAMLSRADDQSSPGEPVAADVPGNDRAARVTLLVPSAQQGG